MNQLQRKHTKKAINMTNSQLFKQAHAMTKQVIQTGDNYAATFAACLKFIKNSNSKLVAITLEMTNKGFYFVKQCLSNSGEWLYKVVSIKDKKTFDYDLSIDRTYNKLLKYGTL